MNLQNIKKLKKNESGFTIVELLIVIVIIGILAALVIVAYTGIQNRAKSTKAQTNAVTIQKKLEACYADDSCTGGNGVYPTTAAGVSAMTNAGSLTGTNITVGFADPTSGNGQTTVGFKTCASGQGYQITWYDYAAGGVVTSGSKLITGGSQTPSCAYPAS